MTVSLIVKFPVDDAELSALHARAFGGGPNAAHSDLR